MIFKCRCWIEKRSVPVPMQGTWKSMIPISMNLRLFYKRIEREYYTGSINDFENDTLHKVKRHYYHGRYTTTHGHGISVGRYR